MIYGKFGTKVEATKDGNAVTLTELKPDKGLREGSCNRIDCQRPGATWYNDSTRAYYCAQCAEVINHWSRIDVGRDICKEQTNAPPSL